MEQETFDAKASCAAQAKLCKEKGYPDFAPSNGVCYDCRRQIYEQIDHGEYKTGRSVEYATTTHITGCPHCHHSYCE